jgi:hypothetical protein
MSSIGRHTWLIDWLIDHTISWLHRTVRRKVVDWYQLTEAAEAPLASTLFITQPRSDPEGSRVQ